MPTVYCQYGCSKIMAGKTEMVKSFAKASIKHAASGLKTRPKKEIRRITAICLECEYCVKNTKIGPRCRICGCGMIKKIEWATTQCSLPDDLKKWDKWE